MAVLAVLAVLGFGTVRADWTAASEAPLSETPSRAPTKPLGSELRIRFRKDGPTWRARVHKCDRAQDDQHFAGEWGCAVLVLRNGSTLRYMPIQDSFQVKAPQLFALKNPDGRTGLLLVETSATEEHADVWYAHLIEDDGQGPRLVFRVVFDACSWADDDAKCTLVHPKAKYIDADRDGDQDLELAYVGANGLRHQDWFTRLPSGRFALPARYLNPDSYVYYMNTDVSQPIGADAKAVSPDPGKGLECPWLVNAPRAGTKVYDRPRGLGKVTSTIDHAALLEVLELRSGFARLMSPQIGWIVAQQMKQRCPEP